MISPYFGGNSLSLRKSPDLEFQNVTNWVFPIQGGLLAFSPIVQQQLQFKVNGQNQNQNSLLVKRQTDNTTPGGDGA